MPIIRRANEWSLDDEGRYWCPRDCGFTSRFKGRVQRHFRERRCAR